MSDIRCLTHLYTPLGLLRDGDGDGLPDGLAARFSVGRTPGAIDVAARLGLESAAFTPGFTAAGAPGVLVSFGPDNPDCPAAPVAVPAGCGVVATAGGGVVVTGDSDEAGWDAARWLAATFPYARPGGPLLGEMAGGRPIQAAIIRNGAVQNLVFGDGTVAATPDKATCEGPPALPPFAAEAPGDLPLPGAGRLFTVAGFMGSSDTARHDRAGWQVGISQAITPAEIAGLCELAARTGVEATGMRFPLAVELSAGMANVSLPRISLAARPPKTADWMADGMAWINRSLLVFGLPDERAATLCRAAAEAGLVEGLHATLFTKRAGLPESPRERGELVFDLALEQEWEVDRFRRVWRDQALPALVPGLPVAVDLRISEPLAVREALAEAMAADLAARQVPEARIRVLPAFKQGFHWLEEEVLPRLRELEGLSRVALRCAPFAGAVPTEPADIMSHHTQPQAAAADDTDRPLEMPIRWLQELYPADELLAAALGVPASFELEAGGHAIYELTAYGSDGAALLSESFSPVCSARTYLPEFPARGRVHPPTGLLRVEQGGRLLAEWAVDTDPEAFWTAYQEQVLPRLRQYVQENLGPDPGAQPFFDALVIEAALSEDDRRLGIREEQISPLDALHEDLYFYTLDYLNELGLSLTGKGWPAPGGIEPWIASGTGGPRARVRLYAPPASDAAPEAGSLATALPAPAPGVPQDQIIGPDQLPPILAYLAGLPGVRVWRTGLSFAGRYTWALSVTCPTDGRIAPPQKLSAWRPTLLVNARRHANEISSTNSVLRLAELVARQGLASKVNLVVSPMENVDGAALHHAMQAVHPNWKLHAARFNAAGVDFGADGFEAEPRYGEARTVPTLWRAFLPDVVLDDHGYPSHEWVQPFSGYSSAPYFRTSWWMPNALIYGIFRWLDAGQFPANGAVQEGLRAALAARVTAHPEIAGYNAVLLDRYQTYGRRHVPEKFPLQVHEGFISLIGQVAAGPAARTLSGRFPHITAAELVTEVPDETAQGDYLALCARAHLEGDLAVFEYLAGRPQPVVRRRWEQDGFTWWQVGRERPLGLMNEGERET